MKIGLRTIKTAIAAAAALFVAERLQLSSAAAAGIIAVLSVTNTKRSTWKTAVNRLVSLTLATLTAIVVFSTLGFHALAFGIYLLIFIPISVRCNVSEGISVSSVLVTHYLIEKSLAPQLILNEYLLMILGVGFALLVNLYMPDTEKELKEDQLIVETMMKKMLQEMSDYLNQTAKEAKLMEKCLELATFIKAAQIKAEQFEENRIWSGNRYYFEYFAMRRLQVRTLSDMLTVLDQLIINEEEVREIRELFNYTAATLAEENDGGLILRKTNQAYERYRNKPLPENREEFENRARLFQLLQLFQNFIEIKAGFSRQEN